MDSGHEPTPRDPARSGERDTFGGLARVIPLHAADELSGALRRARRLAGGARPSRPRPGTEVASVHELPAPHAGSDAVAATRPLPVPGAPSWEARAADALTFVLRRVQGDYTVDDYGFDPDLTEHTVLPLLKVLYDRWFRVEVNGIQNVPTEGGALLVSNHAGGLWALDATMAAVAVHTETPGHRFLRLLGAELVFRSPGLGPLARKAGATMACAADAERLLAAGELVGVWPEGFKGIGKPFSERYKLQRFGRGGFVQAALAAGVPIIPVSIIGSEEIHPVLGNAKTLARILDLPYFPLTPTFPWLGPLGLVPLPSKWYIEFGAPIDTDGTGVSRRRPGRRLRPHRPCARDDPVHALPVAGAAPFHLALTRALPGRAASGDAADQPPGPAAGGGDPAGRAAAGLPAPYRDAGRHPAGRRAHAEGGGDADARGLAAGTEIADLPAVPLRLGPERRSRGSRPRPGPPATASAGR